MFRNLTLFTALLKYDMTTMWQMLSRDNCVCNDVKIRSITGDESYVSKDSNDLRDSSLLCHHSPLSIFPSNI